MSYQSKSKASRLLCNFISTQNVHTSFRLLPFASEDIRGEEEAFKFRWQSENQVRHKERQSGTGGDESTQWKGDDTKQSDRQTQLQEIRWRDETFHPLVKFLSVPGAPPEASIWTVEGRVQRVSVKKKSQLPRSHRAIFNRATFSSTLPGNIGYTWWLKCWCAVCSF